MWDERFAGPGYLFGTDPVAFLPAHAGLIPAGGRVLSLADGEGRNSVWLAGQGFRVTAMEASGVALEKARALARARDVTVDSRQADIADWDWDAGPWDAVVGIFIQFAAPALREAIHKGIARGLRPCGRVFLHGYAPRQIGYGTGGPRAVENLYTLDALRADFPGWRVLVARDEDREIAEGTGHVGKSALIDFVAEKP
ncbi:class I SAM-dependent methyltransferase [Aliigemmobacter aestuarii]|uniref:Class I SAM-dependent methyltransferase n=1 Tax=Aliigemmobacter aestuarii TaxID=1445661 RepID=A0A4S3MJR9_9RHOB|nr:class I SAM-dependent methyltransferase [Gemmobacter aestuarii]THD82192.1 class I SAM-dependent methyltransferase [Gemmobacter aestuarii]